MVSNHGPITSCMVVLDHSQYMLNEDYTPTRFEFQQQAASYIVDCILEEALTMKTNGQCSISIPQIGVMAGTDVLIGPQEDSEIVYEALADNLALATTDLTTSLRVASLALRKFEKENQEDDKQETNSRKVIIAFVGSPLNDEDDNLDHVGRILKRNATEIIIVAIGDDSDEKALQELVSVADGKVVKIRPDGSARDALDGLFGSRAKEEVEHDQDPSNRIGALLNRSRVERGKLELMLKTSFSSEAIPSPPPTEKETTMLAHGSVDPKFDYEHAEDSNDDDLPSPASSAKGFSHFSEEEPYDERESSPLLKALDCGPEIFPTQPTTTSRPKPKLTIQVNENQDAVWSEEEPGNVQLERHMSMSPTSGITDLRREQENIARFANLRQTHISVAEYERVKTELRAAKRYIRVLQRLVHEKDEMISALHDMIGCLRGTEKSEVTSLKLDGDWERKEGDFLTSNAGILKMKNLDEADDNDLKPSLSSDSHISISEIRKRTRELEAMHASLTNKSKALQKASLALRSNSSQTLTMTEKRNKKRELEALRASITVS